MGEVPSSWSLIALQEGSPVLGFLLYSLLIVWIDFLPLPGCAGTKDDSALASTREQLAGEEGKEPWWVIVICLTNLKSICLKKHSRNKKVLGQILLKRSVVS